MEERAVRRAVARGRGQKPRIVVCGAGPAAARAAAETALAGQRMSAALVVGLCGFLVPGLRVADVAVYESVRRADEILEIDANLRKALTDAFPFAALVRGVESDTVVNSPGAKAELARENDAQAVDMESFALVRRLLEGGIAAGVVRVGSDASVDTLPDLTRAIDASGRMRPLRLTGSMLRDPLAAVRLVRNGTRALAALEQTVAQLCG